ncbi:RNA polymerase subunit sigma-70 [Knoellia sinensis KCTC 19936]|uniref:RNA polymerase subunit sigma-70 n=1 Tax=Knoellia sinensis KCTC 19936 TaxID=1385520 RepID=A0A0A0JCY0_9MICO|nr:SigE family RNA polymerase sigma factor [Knoellia sinensis]KGN34654.1 RNA polymerase subunit sigma-70 [Knoellia sinensis KCTC 19936]
MSWARPDAEFVAFVRASTTPLLRVAWLLSGDHHAAQDLVQETHVRMASKWSSIRRHDSDPMAYARTVLHRIHIDNWRRQQRRPERLVSEAPEGRTAVADHDLRLALIEALARLTPRQRSVLVLRYLEDRTEVQAAAVLGCSVSTVKSQARHALGRLRELNPQLMADLAPALKER